MACPDIAQLEQYAAAALDDDSGALIEAHVAECERCEERLSDVSDNIVFIDRLRWGLADRNNGANQATDSSQSVPETIGLYRIIREIGRGGMGVVYEAMQRDPARPVALKLLNQAHAHNSDYARLFQRESRALARLDHPGIASIYEAGSADNGRAFFAMELVRGESTLR